MQDADFERLLDEKFRPIAHQAAVDSIAPAVVANVERQQRMNLIRPWVVLLAAVVGLILSWPGILEMLDLSWLAVTLTDLSHTTLGVAAEVAESWVEQLSSPLAMSFGLICLLAGFAVAAES